MSIKHFGYGFIRVNGEIIHLPSCRNCRQIVAVTQEEREKEGRLTLDWLDEQMTCCSKPDYWYNKSISPFPKERKMEVIEWANGEGYTLKLDEEELEELATLLRRLQRSYCMASSSAHFEVELAK